MVIFLSPISIRSFSLPSFLMKKFVDTAKETSILNPFHSLSPSKSHYPQNVVNAQVYYFYYVCHVS